jgi:hypothetical protein
MFANKKFPPRKNYLSKAKNKETEEGEKPRAVWPNGHRGPPVGRQ